MKLDVFNMMGQSVMHSEVSRQTRSSVDLSNFPEGNYYIVLKDDYGLSGTYKITLLHH